MAANVQLKEMVNSMRAAILNGGGLAGPQVAFQMQRAESAPAELAQNNLEALLSSAFRMTRPEAASRSRNNPFLASIEQPETPAQLSVRHRLPHPFLACSFLRTSSRVVSSGSSRKTRACDRDGEK